ncbi:MAG TPA: alpha-L-rhamnosidase C-terminal domain-containing protein, partial [Mariniphaga sp.]|nr:alpha-L-rhamnosidase C-terminal domain-containing protein [Mariniphaga sp.]
HIHNCYNSIGSWFYQAIGGIRPIEDEPSYRKIIIEPQIPEGITWAKVYKETPFGKVSVDWALEEKLLNLEITIPPGVEAEIAVPSGYKIRENNDNPLQESHDGLTLAHGTYEFFFNKE